MDYLSDSPWISKGAVVAVRSFDEEGKEMVEMAFISEVTSSSITLDNGLVMHGEVDVNSTSSLKMTAAPEVSVWSGHTGRLQNEITPSQHFERKWS